MTSRFTRRAPQNLVLLKEDFPALQVIAGAELPLYRTYSEGGEHSDRQQPARL